MSEPIRRLIVSPPDFKSQEVGVYFAQMENQTERLTTDSRGATVEELAWQPAPGMNTIGMLLGHIAEVEVWWMSILTGEPYDCDRVLGVPADSDGMPLAADALPPANLAGKDLAYYDGLLARARANTRRLLAGADASILTREQERTQPRHVLLNGHWILYHIVEHQAGHYYQINLLRHSYRARASVRV